MLDALLNIRSSRVIPTDTRGTFLNAGVSQIIVNIMRGVFEQKYDLQVDENLIFGTENYST